MKKLALLLILILLLSACRGQYVDGKEFFVYPYAYKGKEITLKLIVQKEPFSRLILYSPDWKPVMPIRFDNALEFKLNDPSRIYLVSFLCKYGSIYHGNYITKVFIYPN